MCFMNGYDTLKLPNYESFIAGYDFLNILSSTDNVTLAGRNILTMLRDILTMLRDILPPSCAMKMETTCLCELLS
jgi:hypothetical protein